MGTMVELEDKIATAVGFHNGARVRAGATFRAPVTFTGRWFRPADEAPEIAEAEENPIARALDQSITAVVESLSTFSDADLPLLLSAEQSGAARKGLMAKISDEIANRIGKAKEDEAFS
jgi:hypothetical protein